MNHPGRRTGFTLIEVLLVIGLLLFLGTLAVVSYTKMKASGDIDATKILVQQVETAVNAYHANMNKYPDNDQKLRALLDKPTDEKEAQNWHGPYLENGQIPTDPWHNEIQYELVEQGGEGGGAATGKPFHVWSYGPDGTNGNEDDIRNWSEQTTGG